ncbi:2-oxo-4-hydroxy-4-carboxy-5-ureidoimidazoline decarboxylase [Mangrovicoccus sp. HB161399]|uniref:2-oxo-4-hydroxy-4-carboxy-5-ureidoimidazoline decarboxylase n=1 Tax=Mangrovicoccus sp. HB161399 TaxID=2720392 RepID=UPI001555C7C4|nr:2-oxo-4-hydroxy-4-carboxy-5-ureidoimidazoline decarboxylase [Mangrovicoccus sp. HB161399]
MTTALDILNDAPRAEALAMIAPLAERSPWVAEAALGARPFESDEALARALVEAILSSSRETRIALFRAHPALAGREAAEGSMTAESTCEQGRLGLLSLSAADAARLGRLNAAYAARFGHPFILALHRIPDLGALFDIFERRLRATPLEEHASTLAEIASVIRSRAAEAFGAAAANKTATPSNTPREQAQ